MPRDSHLGKRRLIFRVGDIGRSIVLVFRATPFNEDQRKTDLAYGGRVGTPVRVVNRRSMVSREQTSRGDSSYFIVIAFVVVSRVRRSRSISNRESSPLFPFFVRFFVILFLWYFCFTCY